MIKREGDTMIIGGKEYNVGDTIKIISAKSILHYEYGIKGDLHNSLAGIRGTIVKEYPSDAKNSDYIVCEVKVKGRRAKQFHNGITRLCIDDELELIKKGKHRGNNHES